MIPRYSCHLNRSLRMRLVMFALSLNRDGAMHPLMSFTTSADYFVEKSQPSSSGCFLFLRLIHDFADPLSQQPR